MLINQKKSTCWVHIVSIIGVGLVLSLPVITNGCLDGHDFGYHLVYSKHFSEQFWQGDFYPRWLQNMNAGLGSPTFFFYAPIPYFFTSLFSPLAHYSASSCNEIAISSLFALIASGITAYFWLKEIVSKNSAIITSIIYMVLPYHLVVDLYIRFAFAEYWSFVWMPLILYFSIKVVRGSRLNIIGLAISFALLALTHLPTFIIFFPVPIGYALFIASRTQWKIVSIRLGLAVIIATGLSAIYWVPAMTTQASISMDAILTGMFYYANNFLFTGPKIGPQDKFFVKYLELLTVLTGGLVFCTWKTSRKYSGITSRHESNYWMIVAVFSFFMTLPLSIFLWDILPVIQRIQFPWRFNAVLTIAITGLLATTISPKVTSNLNKNNAKSNLLLLVVYLMTIVFVLTAIEISPLQGKIHFLGIQNTVLAISIIALLLLVISLIRNPVDFSNHKFLAVGSLLALTIFLGSICYGYKHIFFIRINELNTASIIKVSRGADEHRPRWVPKEVIDVRDLTRLSEKLPMIQIDEGKASYLIRKWQPRKIVLQVNATTETKFTLHQFYYPGWTAKLKGSLQRLPVHFSELGLLQLSVPNGNHEIFLTLDPNGEERIGQIISAVSAILALLLVLFWSRDFNSIQRKILI